ncbi:MAG: hypothetical protein KGZ74_05990 [Chitinophagaceae bacterium]|nr:hypothetical protein [Chitinophagaceae bacterium]
MKRFLTLKHWQLFVLLIGLPTLLQLIILISIFLSDDTKIASYLFPFVFVILILGFYCWFFTLGTNLRKKLPSTISMNSGWFKFSILIPVLHFSIIFLLMISETFSFSPVDKNSFGMLSIIVPMHLLSTICTFYCLYFISKTLKIVELRRSVTFNDYVGEFFLLWFFPIGIWFIQPRINRIFS